MLSIINQEREIGEMITETTRLVLFRNKIEALVCGEDTLSYLTSFFCFNHTVFTLLRV